MVVLTFSGQAIADAQPLAFAADVVSRQRRPCVVAVPALAGIEDRLEQVVRLASDGRSQAARAVAARVADRHRDLAERTAGTAAPQLTAWIRTVQKDIEDAVVQAAETRSEPSRMRERIVAAGPSLAGRLVAAAFRQAGIRAVSVEANQLFGPGAGDQAASQPSPDVTARLQRALEHALGTEEVAIVAGGIAEAGTRTTESSPCCASVGAVMLAAATGARELQVWTSADGVLAADPSVVGTALTVPQLSFAEAVELARWGRPAIHPATLALATSRGTPIVIRNVRRPDLPGTVINGQPAVARGAPAALAWRRQAAALRVTSSDSRAPVLMRRILDLCRESGDEPFVTPVSVSTVIAAFTDTRCAGRVAAAARNFADVSGLDDVALLSAVGESLAADPRVAGEVLHAVEDATVHACARQPSGRSLTMVLDDADMERAMRRVYDRFFRSGEAGSPDSVENGGRA